MASPRALTTTFSLMKLLSPKNAAPFLVRTLGTTSLGDTSSDSDSNSEYESDAEPVPNNPKVCPLVNRFLKEGPAIPYKVIKDDEALYARLDMPGIGKDELKLWVEDNSIQVRGVEAQCPRKYSGEIKIPQGRYKAEEIAAELKNGVLKIRVPKIKLEDRKDVINVKVN